MSLINSDAPLQSWLSVGRHLPRPEDSEGFKIDNLQVAAPDEILGAAGDNFVATAKPEDAPTVELIRTVIADVERQSAQVKSYDDVAGKDVKEGAFIASPEGSKVTYSWKPDFVNWSGDRGSFSYDNGYGAQFAFAKLEQDDHTYDIFATRSGAAPATFVIFDREEKAYTVLNQTDLDASAAKERAENHGLIGG